MRKSFGLFRYSARPKAIASVRRFSASSSINYVENAAGRLETRSLFGELAIELQTSERLAVAYTDTFEFLPRSFLVAPRIVLPVGR